MVNYVISRALITEHGRANTSHSR